MSVERGPQNVFSVDFPDGSALLQVHARLSRPINSLTPDYIERIRVSEASVKRRANQLIRDYRLYHYRALPNGATRIHTDDPIPLWYGEDGTIIGGYLVNELAYSRGRIQ